ncbi:MAG: DUF3696 domain-containing protein [Anaerolinea sp.]|nr:DUF3696 domain-containing protein [Anaerolinea sp.]
MLRSMRMKNFKSWADTGDIRLAPITGFYGANSSGKTSLLQMLLLMKQTSTLNDPQTDLYLGNADSLVNLGTFHSIAHKHDVNVEVEFALTWDEEYLAYYYVLDGEEDKEVAQNIFAEGRLSFTCQFLETDGQIVADWFEYATGEDYARVERHDYDGDVSRSMTTRGKFSEFHFSIDHGRTPDYWQAAVEIDLTRPSSEYVHLRTFLRDQLAQTVYLGPLRATPQRVYVWGGDKPSDVGKTGERMISALLSEQAQGKSGLEQKVAEWLKKMGLIHSFSLRPLAPGRRDYEIVVKKTPDSAEVLITDIGFGVSQLLPVLVLCYYVPEGSTLILEQPEIHLHPSVQADLADVFIDVIKTRKLQIIFESHSEYLLHRLQRRIAEEVLDQDDTALYFCEVQGEESKLKPLELDEYGNIANWPKDFFGDTTGDLVAMTQAEMRRRMANP